MTRYACVAILFLLACVVSAQERIVAIESARTSEYVKTGDGVEGEAEQGSVIRFNGLVVISVTEGSSVSRISADEIIYDKTNDTLEARGNVTYEHTTGKSGSEKFRGEGLLFNIKKQEGVFLDGIVTQDTGKQTSDPFVIHAESTGRDSGSTMAFSHAALTTCDAEDPHWSIKASRIWLLPGNEIAIFNGVFFIGPLPVFYIPIFYYPSDEMVVHPVFGFRNREGYFTQTTTYIFGRKPLAAKNGTENSFADFLGSDTLKEQKRNGLFLRNLDTDAKTNEPDYFKIMADAYSGLGAMVGIDGAITPEGYVNNLTFSAALGFSRTLYPPSTSTIRYSTYDSSGDQTYNKGWFFGNQTPFRFKTNFSMKLDKKPFQLTVDMPFLSDPYFKSDFMDRSEDLNWFKFLTDQDTLAKGNTISEETSYSWNIKGSVTPDVGFLNPWITSLSLTNISGLLTFNSKTNASLDATALLYDPERKFFYPELIKPELRLSIAGTLHSSTKKDVPPISDKPDTSILIDVIKSDKDDNVSAETGVNRDDLDRYAPPAGADSVPNVQPIVDKYALTYTLDPYIVQEINYNSSDWDGPDEINWNSYSSVYYQFKTTAKIQSSFTRDVNYFSITSDLNFTSTHQDHPWLSGPSYDTDTEKDVVKLNDYKASVYLVTTTDSVRFVPFNRDPFLMPISLGWNFTGDVVQSVFDGTVSDPGWVTKFFQWDKDYIDTHSSTAVVGISLANYEQKFTLTSNLPPLMQSYTGSSSFNWAFGSLSMNTKLYEKEDQYKKWFWDPYIASLNWSFPLGIKLGQEYTYDIENKTPSRLHLTASYEFLSAYYTLNNTIPYKLIDGTGWILDGTAKHFIPSAAGVVYNNSSKPLRLFGWKNRIFLQAAINSNLQFTLLKLTDSSLDFSPSVTIKFYELFDLTFSSNSRNDVIARYFQDWMDLPAPLPGETNILKDLYKSVNFFNRQDRLDSGFKLKSLTVTLTHYLHDWTMNLSTTVKPELKENGGIYTYDFIPTVVFVVQWKPISDIKTTVKSEEGVFSLNTKEETTD